MYVLHVHVATIGDTCTCIGMESGQSTRGKKGFIETMHGAYMVSVLCSDPMFSSSITHIPMLSTSYWNSINLYKIFAHTHTRTHAHTHTTHYVCMYAR